MTMTSLEERLTIAERRISTLDTQCADQAMRDNIELAVNTLTWRFITALIAFAGFILAALAVMGLFVLNAINAAFGG